MLTVAQMTTRKCAVANCLPLLPGEQHYAYWQTRAEYTGQHIPSYGCGCATGLLAAAYGFTGNWIVLPLLMLDETYNGAASYDCE
jgi:hypothetical protein